MAPTTTAANFFEYANNLFYPHKAFLIFKAIIFDDGFDFLQCLVAFALNDLRGVDRKTIRRLHANENIETKTLNKLCIVLDYRLEDIAEFVKEEDQSE